MRHLISAIVIVVFTFFAFASKVNKIHMGAFNSNVAPEPVKINYVDMADGSHIEGTNIRYKSGALSKNVIIVDDRTIKISDTRGYMLDGIYYGQFANTYIKRIIHGDINIYYNEELVSATNSQGYSRSRMATTQYYQRGDAGQILLLANQEDIRNAVAGCAKAVEMASISDKEMRNAIKKDRNYLNSIFEVYNNGCK